MSALISQAQINSLIGSAANAAQAGGTPAPAPTPININALAIPAAAGFLAYRFLGPLIGIGVAYLVYQSQQAQPVSATPAPASPLQSLLTPLGIATS